MLCPGRRLSPSGCEGSVPASYLILLCIIINSKTCTMKRFSVASLVGIAAVLASPDAPGSCPAGIHTACAPGSTCCPIFMSQSGWGCCHEAGASCCPQSSTTQGCCPSGTTCVNTSPYDATCVPNTGGANTSALQVCTPGAQFPPNASLPSMIIIGDSVSEGYQPVVSANLSSQIFVQHSPWSVGGGADDINNGLNCEENFWHSHV